MSSFKWGDYDLDVINGNYFPPHARIRIERIPLIPLPDQDVSEHNEIIQGGGRPRIEASMKGILYSFEELNALQDDDLRKTEKLFIDPYGFSMQAIILEFKVEAWKHNQVFEYSITFLEV